jgi:O-antigen/teichoic acid export membrane protein
LATAATIAYAVISVPIALSYLDVEQFGLFVLLIQVSSYFTLFEIGMSAATARFLVDHKDTPNHGDYGSIIVTGLYVFAAQAIFILFIGWFSSPWIVSAMGVPQDLAPTALILLRTLVVTASVNMAFRIYNAVLYANKRLDLIHAFNGGSMLIGLGLLATILSMGSGLEGLAWLFVIQAVVATVLPIVACKRLGLLPRSGNWGRPSIGQFRDLFLFGKDVFLVNSANQILEASQLIIITRTMGLTAAAVWSVSTKLFTLVYQLLTKIEGTAVVFFAEMMVRGERAKLAERFRQVYQLTAGIAIVGLACVVALNKPFVSVWAGPSLAWSVGLSILMAVFVFLNAVTRCGGDLIIHTKRIGAFRYVYLAEAIAFVLLAFCLAPTTGFHGLLGAAIVCLVVFRGTYTTWRIAHYFDHPVRDLVWTWLRRPLLAGIFLAPFVVASGLLVDRIASPSFQLITALMVIGFPAVLVIFTLAIPKELAIEARARWPKFGMLRL